MNFCQNCNQKRTPTQSNALHLFFEQLAESLNSSGLDMRKVLKPSYDISWTKESVKEHLWRPIQKMMYGKSSTTQLSKHEEITDIHKVLMRALGEKFSVEWIEFPHLAEGETDTDGKVKIGNY